MIPHSTLGRTTATIVDRKVTLHLAEKDARNAENSTINRSCGEGRFYQGPQHGRRDAGSQSRILIPEEYRFSFRPTTAATEGCDRPFPGVNEPIDELNPTEFRERL